MIAHVFSKLTHYKSSKLQYQTLVGVIDNDNAFRSNTITYYNNYIYIYQWIDCSTFILVSYVPSRTKMCNVGVGSK